VSTNRGHLTTVTVRDHLVTTGIYRQQVAHPVEVTRLGFTNDKRAEPRRMGEEHHAIHVYPFEHYATWREELHADLQPGHFGENLTLTGAEETRIRIGDVLRIGGVVMQVAQPRIPCRKLDQRMGFKFAKRFLKSRRVGYYLRVLQVGTLQHGDCVELLSTNPTSPSVDDFVRIAFTDYWDADALEWLLSSTDLMDAWSEIIAQKAARAREAEGWFAFRPLKVVQCNGDDGCLNLTLSCAQGKPLPRLTDGQVLPVALGNDAERRIAGHTFVVRNAPTAPGSYLVSASVGDVHGQSVSKSTLSWKFPVRPSVGDLILAAAPRRSMLPASTDFAQILLLSEGIGVTAAHAVLGQLQRAKAHLTCMHFCASASLEPLQSELIARVLECDGRVAVLAAPLSSSLSAPELPQDTLVVACGPREFLEHARSVYGQRCAAWHAVQIG